MTFIECPGPTSLQCDWLTPLQWFTLLFTSTICDYLFNKTNEYAQHKLSQHTKTHSQYKKRKPVTTNEMKAFVGVILNMGIIQLQNLQDYWSTNPTSNIPFFRSVFSRDRFFQIFWSYMRAKLPVPEKKIKFNLSLIF